MFSREAARFWYNAHKVMNGDRRIVVNTLVMYGRSLYAVVLGLFTARWAINALGVTDYGLYGVVGGLMAFVGFLNSALASATSRFYAVAIGRAVTAEDADGAADECCRWFNTALAVHTVIPLILTIVGYPLGMVLIKFFLTIPPDRVADCIWVLRLTCFSWLVGMMNVPFSAMFGAKQRFAEIMLYGCISSTLTAGFLYYMITHPGVWLVRYALWMCMASVLPQLLIAVRACWAFPECRVRFGYLLDFRRVREIGAFAGWNLLAEVSAVLRTNGIGLLVNKAFGPAVNASVALGGSVSSQTASLSVSVANAVSPVIMGAYGAKNWERMKDLVYKAGKIGILFHAIFLIPLAMELPYVLKLWLVTPPAYLTFICLAELLMQFMDLATQGHLTAILASGQIKEYRIRATSITLFTLPAAIFAAWIGGVYAVGGVLVVARGVIAVLRVAGARTYAGLAVVPWMSQVIRPLAHVLAAAAIAAVVPRLVMEVGFVRLCATVVACEIVLLPLAWFQILTEGERAQAVKFVMMHLPTWRGR